MQKGGTILEHFSNIHDPRLQHNKEHSLVNIMTIAICGVLCGADSWTDIEQFGNDKIDWLTSILDLPNGIPSHDTFGRVFSMLDAEEFEASFAGWVKTAAELCCGDIVAIDGKTNRRSHNKKIGQEAIHLVSAFAARNGLTLGQKRIDKKSNELKAIPKLLKMLNVSGCIVTIDAAGCYPEVVDKIVEKQGDYVIAVKRNQPTLYNDIEKIFQDQSNNFKHNKTTDYNHGRKELRKCWVVDLNKEVNQISNVGKWKNLFSVVKVVNARTVNSQTTTETRYYISSLKNATSKKMLQAVRQHWSIENSLHWILDIGFREDESRMRQKNSQENFSLLRKIALNLIKQEKSVKVGVAAKRKKAGWSEEYLLKILNI